VNRATTAPYTAGTSIERNRPALVLVASAPSPRRGLAMRYFTRFNRLICNLW